MTKIQTIGLVIAGVIVSILFSASSTAMQLGGIYNQVTNEFRQGLKAGTSNQFVISNTGAITTGASISGDTTVSGGTLTVTSSNTATSTVVVGCVQFYATSTATAHKFQASTTPGVMYSQYGTCPNL
jgi:hypothetical protein